jgi:hypothetical protein
MQHYESSGDWNMKPYAEVTNSLSTLDGLDQICMSSGERLMARAYLRKAELFADVLLRVGADLRRAFGFAGRSFGVFACHRKASAVPPERSEWSTP